MLQHLESLVREHVDATVETLATKSETTAKTTQVQRPVERMRGGLSSSPIAAFAGTERTPKPKPKPVPLPLPRRVHRVQGVAKVAPVQPAVVGGSKEEPIVLDDDDVPMDLEDSKGAPIGIEHAGQTVTERNGESANVALHDTVKESVATAATVLQGSSALAQSTTHAPASAETSQDDIEVKTEESAESSGMRLSKQDATSLTHHETLPGDTSEEEEPLSVVIKAKQANAMKAEDKPMIRINLKQHRSSSNVVSESNSSNAPLRIRIPSLRKSSPSRISIPPYPSEPTSPAASSSPSSPNLPTSTAETPWESDLSDLTPMEDSTDEGESEVDEEEPDGDTGEERPKVSIRTNLFLIQAHMIHSSRSSSRYPRV